MTNQSDELLFGAESTRARDTDGDGVSDVQESLDGTDPNDADSKIRHDRPVLDPTGNNGPRVGIEGTILERETIIDVAGSTPEGHSLEQTLGTGLDGKPIGKSPNDLGYGDGDKLLEGRGTDPNSPLNMHRNPLTGNTAAKPPEGRDATKDTLGREAGPGAGGNQVSDSGSGSTPPPGADLSFRAPHTDQISGTDGGTEDKSTLDAVIDWLIPTTPTPDAGTVRPDGDKPVPKPAPKKPVVPGGPDDYLTNPDADTGGGVVTDEQIERAIVLQGTDTDFVPGAGTQIDADSPPKRPIDLVTDGGDEDPGAGESDGTVTPPDQQISRPVNPQDGLPGGGLPPGSGTGNGGGDGGDNTGRDGFSSAATAATNTGAPGFGSGVTNIGAGSTGGIQSVAGDDTGATATTDGSGRASQSYAMMAGDDDGLEELEVQRADSLDAEPRVIDSDGDGVSDAQEILDGTDPNNARDHVTEPAPVIDSNGSPPVSEPELNPLAPNDPRAAIDQINLERETVVDVLGGLPDGHTLDQTLGTGLDGQLLGKSTDHYGNADAEGLLAGRGMDPNSPLNMGRESFTGNNPAESAEGRNPTTDTLGREAGSGVGGEQKSEGGIPTAPPSGTELSFRAPNMSLVSDSADGGTPAPDPHAPPKTAEEKVKERDSNKENRDYDKWKKEQSGKTVNPDADTGGGGVVTEDQIERAIVLQGTDTDFVPGAGTQIDADSPPKRPIDLVTDGGEEDPGAGENDGTVTPPDQQISRPVNPQDGLPGGGLPPGSGTGNGGGDGGDNTGRDGFSSAATAATGTGSPGFGSGVTNIGGGAAGGIQTVAGDDTGATATTDSSGRASQSYAMMAGDDDDLEELEVQRADMAAAGPGTQTEDEIYIGATSAPVDPTGGDSNGGSAGSDVPAPADPAALDHVSTSESGSVSLPVAMVGDVIAPILEFEATEVAVASDVALGIEASPRGASAPAQGADAVATIPIVGPIIGHEAENQSLWAPPTPLDPIDDSVVEVQLAIDDPVDDLVDEPFAQRSIEIDDLVPDEANLDEGF